MVDESEQIKVRLTQIYDSYRIALMNQKYYRYELSRLQRFNSIFEIVIAVGTSGSGVSAWALWDSDLGKVIWAVIAGPAAILAIIKPIIKHSKVIEDYSTRHTKYSVIVEELDRLIKDIGFKHKLEPDHNKSFDNIPKLFGEISKLEKEPPKKQLLDQCFDEVNKEHPPESFWMP